MTDPRGKVLVVEDSPSIRKTVQFVLARAGFDTLTAADGEQGLACIHSQRPRVVLLDVLMPRLDGFEVCRRVREDPTLQGTCIVMLTGKGQRADEERAIQMGADRYVTKPFDGEAMVDYINGVLDTPRGA